jgi:hypothetical protein
MTCIIYIDDIVSAKTFSEHIERLRTDPNNIAKNIEWRTPQNATEIRQFLGLCSYYRKYVRTFSSIAKPLNVLTKNDSNLIWNNDCRIAFNILKGALTSPDVMALPKIVQIHLF